MKHNQYSILQGGPELLARVGPMWEKLRRHHADCDPQWSHSILQLRFDERKEQVTTKAVNGLRVLLAECDGDDAGYCICTLSASHAGEIDSLYVDRSHRRNGLGLALMNGAFDWLRDAGAKSIGVSVLHANAPALRFYKRHGFRARSVYLVHVE